MEKPVYEETFTKTCLKKATNYVIASIIASHPASSGWVHGEPKIEPLDDKRVQVSINLKKYDINKEENRTR